MLSSKAKYALKAMTRLAHAHDQGPQQLDDIAQAENIPRSFLSGILVSLTKNGLLTSKKGKGGGYVLAAAPSSISVARIVHLLDGQGPPPHACCGECPEPGRCSIRSLVNASRLYTEQLFRTMTLDQLAANISPRQEPRR